MSFTIRKFEDTKNLGSKLHAMRRAANFTLDEMAAKTKIHRSFLQAFEQGAFHDLPAPIYARNYLKTYVQALGGNIPYFLDLFEQECGTCDFVKAARLPRTRVRAIQFLVASKYLKVVGLFLVLTGIVGYLGYQVHGITTPPELVVHTPADGSLTEQATIDVEGLAEIGSEVHVNGERVLLNPDGSFFTTVALERGLNVIEVEGAKRYSKHAVEYRRVLLEQGPQGFGLAP